MLCALLAIPQGNQLFAQLNKETISIQDLTRLKPEIKQEVPQVAGKPVPMDSPVDPAEYSVGPGDVLMINIWSSSPVEHLLTVTPEATLLIPSVGAVDVKGITLEMVKKNVSALVQERYPHAPVSVTLLTPRQVIVQITGNVLYETTYEMRSVQRVDNLMTAANNAPTGQPTSKNYLEQLTFAQQTSSKRHILLKRRDGTTQRVDLVRYETTRNGTYDPYLREGDVVFVPFVEELKKQLGVFGGVSRSAIFEFVEGDSLTDLIAMGLGFSPFADSEHVKLTRLSVDASHMDTVIVDVPAIREGKARNVALRPGDRVVVPVPQDQRSNYRVEVNGEVVQPGQYPITRYNTRLSEIIRAAGGFTKDANINGAVLIRSRINSSQLPEQIDREQSLSMRSSLAAQDSNYYLTETTLRLKGEAVSVDFHRLFVLGDTTQDVTLRSYDQIVVPPQSRSVYVFGQVISPGHVAFIEGQGYKYYVEKAGGYTKEARSGDVKIIKGSTRAWLDPDETSVEDGDFIWVPKEPTYPFSHYITIYAQIASIVGVVATVALLIKTY
jgi:protein involved in polysaccharide export with SLBB domain